nr:L,D-transpeptidase family protein [Neobacillus mesonae]
MFMSTLNETIEEVVQERVNRFKPRAKRNFIVIGIITIIALLFAGISYYQATRFNSQITINDTNVGGLTAEQAIKKLKTSVLTNKVYVGQQQILDEKETKMGFTEQDLPEIKKILKSQWTFFPSSKVQNYLLIPDKMEQFRGQTLKKQLEEKLLSMNKELKAPQDAEAKLEQGKIVISNSIDGEQYDIARILEDYQKQKYNSDIRLNPVLLQPIKADSPIIKEEENLFQALLQRTVDYKVQDQVYTLNASELIKDASLSKDKKITISASDIKNKIDEINRSQSTLNKNFSFKTHSGSVISVKGQGYGWALNIEKETARIQEAFEKGEQSIPASNIYGNGWDYEPIGYETTTNNGIGDTYAEVSIAQQRIWIYKNGKLAVTTNVVTGKHSTNEGTHPGVWYILFKQSPHTLRGSAAGNPNYSVKVSYWAPFTNDGQGFHDASWRRNWSSSAYLTAGSAGCVNTPPSIMKIVYDNLSKYDPVIIY